MKKNKSSHLLQQQKQIKPQAASTVALELQHAVWLHQQGQLAHAETVYRQILRTEPRHFDALHFLGILTLQAGNAQNAIELIGRAIEINPDQAAAHSNISNALRVLHRHQEALASCDRALRLAPDYAEAHNNRGNALRSLNRHEEALASFDCALQLNLGYTEALYNRGTALMFLNRHEDALDSFDQVLRLYPDSAEVLNDRGSALLGLNRHGEALSSCDRALQLKPDYVEAMISRGNALQGLKRYAEALASFDRALQHSPDYAEAWNNRGNALMDLERQEEALVSYGRALQLKPHFAAARSNHANALVSLRRHEEAATSFAQLIVVSSDYEYAVGCLFHSQMQCCDWTEYTDNIKKIANAVSEGKRADAPFSFLSVSESVASQLHCARIFIANKYPPSSTPLWTGQRYGHDKIRVAYLSADFHNHAVAYLMAGLFEAHDKERFEITAISFGPDDNGDMRKRLQRSFDRFVDVRDKSDREISILLQQGEIDIAVNLGGFTTGNRTGILANRAAPVQVSYLGYPGTMGAEYVDYILADPHVIPPEHRASYAEKVVYLPDSYMVNDSRRAIADCTLSRAEAGLPENGFVFCCFNNNFKITPDIFDIWMRLLHEVKGSVLWLSENSTVASNNLRKEASQRGICAERLIFAPRMKLVEEHLARQTLADLFLDTLPYNAHTTASDALWAGLPVLSCTGNAFAGRVAASLLHAIGLPELVTATLAEYEALALKLATMPDMLAGIRAKLARNRTTHPLFDTDRFRRHMEAAYITMWERYQNGEPPASFAVQPIS